MPPPTTTTAPAAEALGAAEAATREDVEDEKIAPVAPAAAAAATAKEEDAPDAAIAAAALTCDEAPLLPTRWRQNSGTFAAGVDADAERTGPATMDAPAGVDAFPMWSRENAAAALASANPAEAWKKFADVKVAIDRAVERRGTETRAANEENEACTTTMDVRGLVAAGADAATEDGLEPCRSLGEAVDDGWCVG